MGHLNRNLCYVEIYRAAQNTGDHFKKKNMAFPEGFKLFSGGFRANLDETNADMVQFTKMELEMDYLTPVSVLHQSVCIFKAGLSSSYAGWIKYKKNLPGVSDPN